MPPPVIDAIVGPPGVGKTALEPRETIHRPVSEQWEEEAFDPMIDIGKVADLAFKWFACDNSWLILQVQFEFLNILQAHGFPRDILVFTHLDPSRKQSTCSTVDIQMEKYRTYPVLWLQDLTPREEVRASK